MTEPVPDDGISAFFDEELSPSELKEVAHHLSRSPAAQSELAEIRRLSEELRHLPRESAPRFLRPEVMNEVQGKSLPASAIKGDLRKYGRKTGIVLAASVALALCTTWLPSIWNGSNSTDPNSAVAVHTPSGKDLDEIAKAGETASPGESREEAPTTFPLGSEGQLLSERAGSQALGGAQGFSRGGAINPKLGDDQPSPSAPPKPMGITTAALPEPHVEGDKFRFADSEMKQLMESASSAANRVVIVELTVADTEGTLKQLQTLLAQSAVAPANLGRDAPAGEEKQKPEADSQLALFVQSTPEQLAGALEKLRAQQPTSQMNAIRNLPLSEVLLIEGEEEKLADKDQAGQNALQSLAQIVAKYESAQVAQGKGGKAPEGSATRFRADPNADNTPRRAMKTQKGPAKEPSPSIASQELGALMLPGNTAGQTGPARWKSFQMVLETSKTSWQQESSDQAEAEEPKKNPSFELQTERANSLADQVARPAKAAPKESAAPLPIRTLFIFRALPNGSAK